MTEDQGPPPKRWLPILVVALLFAVRLLTNSPSQAEIPAPPTEPLSPHQQPTTPQALTESPLSNPEGTLPASSEEFLAAVRACAGESEIRRGESTEHWLKRFLEKNPAKEVHFDVENFHIKGKDGSTRRLHLIYSPNDDQETQVELRYFKLDAEGLPERIPLTPEQTYNPSDQWVQSLKNDGTMVFHQLKENRLLQDGSRLALNWVNDRIYEFQLYRERKTLSCRRMECQCR